MIPVKIPTVTIARPRLFAGSLLLALIMLLLDQASKQALLAYFPQDQHEIVLTPFFNLVKVWNYGVSFGMFADQRQPLILTMVSLVIIIALLVWLARSTDKVLGFGLGMVIGGAIGNIIDRIRFGAVADFLDFHVAGYHWPAFNIADSCIFIGVVLLCVHSMLAETKPLTKGPLE
jgi:signal peptidase II